ncbi:D-glycero-beta-D-manno-heptose-7-phosphate kinase [bacterium]
MIQIKKQRLMELADLFSMQKLVVIGDFMLDRYIAGKVSRISPEAPVPVVEVESEFTRFGGAANVALNISTLGASVFPIGLIGADDSGVELQRLFQNHKFEMEGILVDESRPTTVKTRVIADSQQVVRTDWEKTHPISDRLQKNIISILKKYKDQIDGIILEDYNKGLLTPSLIEKIISFANAHQIMTFVDPKYDHFFEFNHVTLFKPNRNEVADQLHVRIDHKSDLIDISKKLFAQLNCKALLITLGEDGMMLFEQGEEPKHVPTKAVKVHDVSGAGDTVISTMAVAMTSGSTCPEAATLANHAAGIVCGEVGVVPIHHEQLFKVMLEECD